MERSSSGAKFLGIGNRQPGTLAHLRPVGNRLITTAIFVVELEAAGCRSTRVKRTAPPGYPLAMGIFVLLADPRERLEELRGLHPHDGATLPTDKQASGPNLLSQCAICGDKAATLFAVEHINHHIESLASELLRLREWLGHVVIQQPLGVPPCVDRITAAPTRPPRDSRPRTTRSSWSR